MSFSVSMMLANFAQAQKGQGLMIVGAGWVVRDPVPSGSAAIAAIILAPREYLDRPIAARLELYDADGHQAEVTPLTEDGEDAGGPRPIQIEGNVTAGGLDDPNITIPLSIPLAVNLPPFRLPPGQEFRWQLFLDGETHPDWVLPFRTTPPEPSSQSSE
jgi:hypothetical protein